MSTFALTVNAFFTLLPIQQFSNSYIVCFIQQIKLKVLTDLIEISIDMPSFYYYYSFYYYMDFKLLLIFKMRS